MKHRPSPELESSGWRLGVQGVPQWGGPRFCHTSFLLVPGTPNAEGWLPWGQWA